MLGDPNIALISDESKADDSVAVLETLIAQNLTDETRHEITCNVQHLELVLPTLSVPKQKKDDINALILTAKALVE